MAKKTISEVEIDLDAHKNSTPAERATIFAHLTGKDKKKAVDELEAEYQPAPAPPDKPAEKK